MFFSHCLHFFIQNPTVLYASQISWHRAVCETSTNVENAFVHMYSDFWSGLALDGSLITVLIGLSVRSGIDGAHSTEASHILHCSRADCSKF